MMRTSTGTAITSTGAAIRTSVRWCVPLVAAVLLAGCVSTSPALPPPVPTPAPSVPADRPLPDRLVGDVDGAGALVHLEALQRIADQNGGNRASPGPGYEASVEYVAGVLRAAGYDVSTPTYPVRVRGARKVDLRNVVAHTRTGDQQRVVMAGAHLDSVSDGPGINDNGSGVAALLEIATRLGGSPEVRNSVRFAFWGSEEDELNGSTYYVEMLPEGQRDDVMLYINLDMIASANAGYFLQGGEGDGPAGSAEVARVLADQLAVLV
jgi:aminopeptidase S